MKLGKFTKTGMSISYIAQGEQEKVEAGEFEIVGRSEDGSIIVDETHYTAKYTPSTNWSISQHNASEYGTKIVNLILGGGRFSFPKSLYAVQDADDEGIATIKLNSWEEAVIEEEGKQKDFVCWLRNPSRGTWALCLPYEMHGETKAMYPDFIIVRYDPILNYVIDILEPHSFDFADNLGKAKGLARYAEAEPRIGRVQLIHPSKDPAGKTRLKRLDLSKGSVRNKVLQATTNDDLAKIFDTDGFFS